jgi:hypothetical protein
LVEIDVKEITEMNHIEPLRRGRNFAVPDMKKSKILSEVVWRSLAQFLDWHTSLPY